MEKKNKILIKIFLFSFLFIVILFYNNYHYKIIHNKESYYYYNIINSLENRDIKTTKYYSKKIFSYKTGDIYYDISCFILYNFEFNSKKIYYRQIILNNKKSIFKKMLDK